MRTLKKRYINRIYKLQQSLLTKEYKLASYIRMDIRNCMDACTTSPVESNNNSIKHGAFGTHTNMNLEKGTQRMIDGFNSRLCCCRNIAVRETHEENNALCALTKHLLIR